jgi:hypothetical protein
MPIYGSYMEFIISLQTLKQLLSRHYYSHLFNILYEAGSGFDLINMFCFAVSSSSSAHIPWLWKGMPLSPVYLLRVM